jgi:hypothetical protein
MGKDKEARVKCHEGMVTDIAFFKNSKTEGIIFTVGQDMYVGGRRKEGEGRKEG